MASSAATLDTASDLDVLHQLNHHYVRSVQDSDIGWFDANLADDFLNSNPDGTLVDRAGFLAQIARKSLLTNLREEDVRIVIRGDFAFIHARTTYARPDGAPGAGRYTDIWWKRDGRWLCVTGPRDAGLRLLRSGVGAPGATTGLTPAPHRRYS